MGPIALQFLCQSIVTILQLILATNLVAVA